MQSYPLSQARIIVKRSELIAVRSLTIHETVGREQFR